MKKVLICFIVLNVFCGSAIARANEVESDMSEEVSAEADIDIDFDFGSILEEGNNELEEQLDDVLEKNADNPIVKFFKRIVDILTAFLDALFDMASDAAKVGEDL